MCSVTFQPNVLHRNTAAMLCYFNACKVANLTVEWGKMLGTKWTDMMVKKMVKKEVKVCKLWHNETVSLIFDPSNKYYRYTHKFSSIGWIVLTPLLNPREVHSCLQGLHTVIELTHFLLSSSSYKVIQWHLTYLWSGTPKTFWIKHHHIIFEYHRYKTEQGRDSCSRNFTI